MDNNKKQDDFEKCVLYISYDYLPLAQQANILTSIDAIYNIILSTIKPIRIIEEISERTLRIDRYIPLCIESVNTGDSIIFKFNTSPGKLLPRMEFVEHDIVVLVPKLYAALFLAAAALSVGIDQYKKILDIQKERLEIKKLEYEISQFELNRLQNNRDPAYNHFHININRFYYEINQSNIDNVIINGMQIKKK